MGLQPSFRPLPFARLYRALHRGDVDIALSVVATPSRAQYAHYTAPIATEYTVLMTFRHQPVKADCVQDLASQRIAGRLGFAYPMIDQLKMPIQRENSYETLIQRVADGHLHGALLGSITGPYLARQLGVGNSLSVLPLSLGSAPIGAALSKSRFDDADLAAFDRHVAAFRQSDTWRDLIEGFGVAEQMHEWPLMAFCIAE